MVQEGKKLFVVVPETIQQRQSLPMAKREVVVKEQKLCDNGHELQLKTSTKYKNGTAKCDRCGKTITKE